MEPDVVRLYSSSPPPLDEFGEEEDEDEFGEFGGYSGGVSSSFSFSECDTPKAFGQSEAGESSPPELYITSIQSVSKSGKNTRSEEKANFRPSECENSVSMEEDKEVEVVSNGVSPSSPINDQHRVAHSSIPQASSTYSEGHFVSDGENVISASVELEVSSLVSDSVLAGSKSAPKDGGIVKPEATQELSSSKESMDKQGHESPEGPSGEVQPHDESQDFIADFVEHKKTPVGPPAEVIEVGPGMDLEDDFKEVIRTRADLTVDIDDAPVLSKVEDNSVEDFGDFRDSIQDLTDFSETQEGFADFVEHKDSPVGPPVKMTEVGPGMELEGDFRKVNRSGTDLTVDLKDAPGLSEVEDNSVQDFRDAVQVLTDFSQTQEGFADFVTALSSCSMEDDFGDTDTLKDLKEDEDLPEEKQEETDEDDRETWFSELPPSDSFADFSSAPFGGLAGGAGDNWAPFGLQEAPEDQQDTWAAFDDEQESISTTTAPSCDSVENDMAGLSCKLQELFQSTFPSEVTPEVTEVVTLQALLEPRDQGEGSDGLVQGEAAALWRHLLDPHSAHGLKVQWVGSHSNRILLDCLGIRNILFTGQKKQPLIVPMFAAGLGMLEPTKDPVKLSPTSPAPRTPSSPGQGRSSLCTQQVASSLSCADDDAAGGAVSQLNLDFFWPQEDTDTDSDTDTPIPGVDPELYELTTAKLETSNCTADVTEALNRLMKTVEKTSTVSRRCETGGEMSEEASQVISVLPDLSFMRSPMLMFPCSLTPSLHHL